MSGSGGGGGPAYDAPVSNCASLSKVTTLNSPVPSVVSTLSVNDELLVRVDPAGSSRVEAHTRAGAVAGSITFSGIGALIKCIEDGWEFIAIVQKIAGGDVTLEVRIGPH